MASPDQIKNILDNIVLVSESVSPDNDRYSKQVSPMVSPMEVSQVEVEKKVPAILRRRPSRDGPARVPFTYDTMVNNVNQARARLGRHPIESARSSQPASNVNQVRYNAGVAPIRDAVLSTQRNMCSL